MTEPRPDDTMIEIGDLEDDSTAGPPPPPQVVIEYRDRGIPWMLLPPLLVLVAVVAGVSAYNYTNQTQSRRPLDSEVAPASSVKAETDADDLEPLPDPRSGFPVTGSRFGSAPGVVPQPVVIENPPAPAPVVVPEPAKPAPALIAAIETNPTPSPAAPPVEPEPAPRPSALMFDPSALAAPLVAASPEASGAPVDQNLAPAARGVQTDDVPGVASVPDQPAQVEDDLLPPDPRKNKALRMQRVISAHRQAEAERFEFSAKLTQIYKQLGARSGPRVRELCEAYGQDIPPAAKEKAMKLLGRSGDFAGARPGARIALLRNLGFPESAILGDVFDMEQLLNDKGGRDAPSREAIYLTSIRTLLSYPPGRPSGSARPVPHPSGTARN